MRIQETNMEFVTFGAQDVIATSGPGGIPMAANFTAIQDYNYQYGIPYTYKDSTGRPQADDGNRLYQATDFSMGGFYQTGKEQNWVVFDASGDSLNLRTKDHPSTTTQPTGDYWFADTVDEIMTWLKANGVIQ